MKKLSFLVVLLLFVVPALAGDQPPGPMGVKVYRYPVVPVSSSPKSYVQRVYLRLDNPTRQPIELVKLQGIFMTPEGEELFTDRPPMKPIAAGAGQDVTFRYANPSIHRNLLCRVSIKYKLGGKAYERHFELTRQAPASPDGYVPR